METQVLTSQINIKMEHWQRSAFNGKCQVIILSGKTSSDILLEIKSNGLVSDQLTIKQN
jgi:beta-galactosidase